MVLCMPRREDLLRQTLRDIRSLWQMNLQWKFSQAEFSLHAQTRGLYLKWSIHSSHACSPITSSVSPSVVVNWHISCSPQHFSYIPKAQWPALIISSSSFCCLFKMQLCFLTLAHSRCSSFHLLIAAEPSSASSCRQRHRFWDWFAASDQSQQWPDYFILVLEIILPDYPLAWGGMRGILLSPTRSEDNGGRPDLKA